MENNWKVVSSREIFKHKRITLAEDEIILPSGQKTEYLLFKFDYNAATIIPRRQDGKIMIAKEYYHPLKDSIYQLCGGAIPLDEKIEDGAKRELAEEFGLEAGKLEDLGYYYQNPRRSQEKMYVFLATELNETEIKRDAEEEDMETFWKSEAEIDEMIRNGEIVNINFLAPWSLYKSKK